MIKVKYNNEEEEEFNTSILAESIHKIFMTTESTPMSYIGEVMAIAARNKLEDYNIDTITVDDIIKCTYDVLSEIGYKHEANKYIEEYKK